MYIDTRVRNDNGTNTYIIDLFDYDDKYYFGFIEIFEDEVCYVISGKVNHFERNDEIQLFETRKEKLRKVFKAIKSFILTGDIPLDIKNKRVLILDDELISRDAIEHMKLKRVPRYCGYYFI